MPSSATIKDVSVATIRGQLPAPVIFGDWVMKEREFAAVRITTDKGLEGWAFTLTRDGACAEQIRKAIAPVYVGTDIADREKTFKVARGRTYGSHSAGIGLRALSLMDLACWDIAAKLVDKPIAEFLGGKAKPMPATAIIGYPPALMPPQKVGEQVRELCGGRLAPLQMPDGRHAGRIGRAPEGSARGGARCLARHRSGVDVPDRRRGRRLCRHGRPTSTSAASRTSSRLAMPASWPSCASA